MVNEGYSADIQRLIIRRFGDHSAAAHPYGSCVVRAVGRSRMWGVITAARAKLIEVL